MAEPTGDNLSVVWQALAAAGVFVGGVVAAVIGKRAKGDAAEPDEASDLRAQLKQELLRRELEAVFGSHRIAMENRFREFESAVHDKIDALSEERRAAIRGIEERLRDLEIGRRQR